MDLSLTDDQESIRDLFSTFFEKEVPSDVVREHEALGFAPEVWSRLRDTGAFAMSTSEANGGGGVGLFESALVAEEVGRRVAPVPFAEHVVAVRLLERVGAPADLLARVVDASEPATFASTPLGRDARLVPAGAVAGVLVALDASSGDLVAIEESPPGEAVANLANLPLARRAVPASRDGVAVLASGADATAALASAVDEWRVLMAAMLVGVSDRALELGLDYVKTRHQFGVPIGTFQAIQHGLAEVTPPIAGAHLLVAKAAWAVDHDPAAAPRLAGMALLFTAELAQTVTYRAMHYHGGYGVMAEYDPQLYYRRAKGWPLQLGDPKHEYQHLADVLYGAARGAGTISPRD
jgi:alkylation response protein AidB-like acyl-CoA dehydrogenase